MKRLGNIATLATRWFHFIALFLATIAAFEPAPFVALKPAIVPLLSMVMFGMGMTLTPTHFHAVLKRPFIVGIGVLLQFLIMPAAAWVIAALFGLGPTLTTGLVLVGACPGGTASNVITYLANGNVALSVTITTASTLAAVFLTPLLTWIYVGAEVDVPMQQMLFSILKIVIAPVAFGVLINQLARERLQTVRAVFPLLSVLSIALIVGIVVGLNADRLAGMAMVVVFAVLLHNFTGLALGYGIANWLGYDKRTCRTLAIEVGMQNSGLGVALANQFFTASAALPGAVFSIWHNLSGATLASYWARKDRAAGERPD